MNKSRRKINSGRILHSTCLRKGISELTWTYILLTMTLIILTIASTPLFNALEAGSRGYAKVKADEIAAIINNEKNSPSSTFLYSVPLPRDCRLEVNNNFVRMLIGKNNGTSYIVQNRINVENKKISCSESAKRMLDIKKSGDRLTVVPSG